MLDIRPIRSDEDVELARRLFREYESDIGVDLCFQGFAQELAGLPGDYVPARGCLLIARWAGEPVGCVAMRPHGDDICEMKRLYVRPGQRGRHVGRALVEAIIAEAGRVGYRRMRLDTLPSMATAIAMYRRLGFVEIDPYTSNPVAGALFMELTID